MADDEKRDAPGRPEEEQPAEEERPAAEEQPAPAPPAEPEGAGDAPEPPEGAPEGGAVEPEGDEPVAGGPEEPAPEEPAAGEPAKPPRRRKRGDERKEEEIIPGAHLEPDLVLEDQREEEEAAGALAGVEFAPEEAPEAEEPSVEAAEPEPVEPEPLERRPIELAVDARYRATGKRKSAVARVVLKPGAGEYEVNGRPLDEFFPRVRLRKVARQPLETAGYESRMDVVARIHGGGVSSQAGALRHGIARALVEADPGLRLELKRRGYLTRDPREKERKKAGLKKARKRPQFSKR